MSRLPAGADVVVVGAGITGASVGFFLARQGVSVVLVEQSARPAAGATGRSGGMVRAYDPDPVVAELATASLAVYRSAGCWASGTAPLHAVGAVTVDHPAHEPALREAAARINRALGSTAHVLAGRDEVAGIRLAGGVALVEPEAGWVDPVRVSEDWLAQAVDHGATVCRGVRVERVEADGTRPVVHTDAGAISAGAVVAAVGPWAAEPVPGLRPAAPVRSRSIQVSIVERSPSTLAHPTFVDLRTGRYAKPVGADQTLIGMPHPHWDSAVDAAPDAAHADATVAALSEHFPWLATAPRVRTDRSADAYLWPDGQPAELLSDTGVPHVRCVRGWNGGGVRIAPEAGRRIAHQILTDVWSDISRNGFAPDHPHSPTRSGHPFELST